MATDSDNFENAVKDKTEEQVAEFEAHEKGVIGFVHQTLHKYPFFVPLIVMIVLLIKLTSPGPATYAQKRIGKGGRPGAGGSRLGAWRG